jgi:glycosyltransferase involved in cell wall biosynthesis
MLCLSRVEFSVVGLTVLTLVPNAGDRLPRSLGSVSWAGDLFCVVDAKTDDGSETAVRDFTDHIAVRPYENAADQRNWALPQIGTEWTLVLDADEWVSESLAAEIQRIVQTEGGPDGYEIKRRSYFFGKSIRYCGWQRDYNLRLFRTTKGRYLKQRVHSHVVVEGPVTTIEAPMYHDTYRDFEEYFATMQRFTSWGAADAYEKGKRARLSDLTLRPLIKFLKMYVLRRGFLDGYPGAVLCGLSAFSVFLKYAKLWAMTQGDSRVE